MDNKYKKYLRSQEWINIKIDLIQTRGSKCERCGARRTATKLQLHHRTYETLFNESSNDLELLCGACHKREHGIGVKKIKKKPKFSLAQKVLMKKKTRKRYLQG